MPTRAETIAADMASPRSVTVGPYVFSLPEGVKLVNPNTISFRLAVTKNGVAVNNPHLSEPITVVNPPRRVPDGTTTPVLIDGTVRLRPNYVANHAGILRVWLQHIVRELKV